MDSKSCFCFLEHPMERKKRRYSRSNDVIKAFFCFRPFFELTFKVKLRMKRHTRLNVWSKILMNISSTPLKNTQKSYFDALTEPSFRAANGFCHAMCMHIRTLFIP